jgi:phosphoglycerate dehydrogenase-like enzyme
MKPLRLLVAKFSTQKGVYKIEPQHIEDALARWSGKLPPLEVKFHSPDAPDFADQVASADFMIGYRFPAVLPPDGALKLIQLTGAGFDHLLPLDWLPRRVTLSTARGVHAPKLKEWAAMVLLMLHSEMPHFMTAQRAHQWSKAYSSGIAGKTALILGAGAIGGAIAAAAHGLEVRTIGVRRVPRPTRGFESVIAMDAIGETIGGVDFVILALPLTPATRLVMSEDMFARMKKGAGFANFGRGPLVDQTALIAALTSGHLGGAVIDVTDPEPPPPDSSLWDTPRLMITPHVSCDDPITHIPRTLDLLFDNILRQQSGRPVRNRVIRNRAY